MAAVRRRKRRGRHVLLVMAAIGVVGASAPVVRATAAGPAPGSVTSYAQLPASGQDYDTEPYLAVDPLNAAHVVVGFMRRVNNTDIAAVQCWVAVTTDGGQTWTQQHLTGDTERNCADMSVAFGPDGTVYTTRVAYVGTDVGQVYLQSSSDGGMTWSAPTVVLDGVSDQLGVDRPWVLVDDGASSPHKGNLYVVAKTAFFDYLNPHLYFKRSTDGGHTFSPTLQLDAAPYPGYYTIMETAAVSPDGTVLVGYKSRSGCSSYCYTAAVSTDGGSTFALRPMPNPAYPSGASDTDETMPVVVAANPKQPGQFAAEWLSGFGSGSEVDVAVSVSADSGATWSAPVKINDGTYPANAVQDHPWIVWGANGDLYASWRDRRNDPSQSATANFDLYAAYSADGGITWSQNLRLSPQSSAASAEEAGDDFIGEAVAPDGTAWTGWAILSGSSRQVWLAHWTMPTAPTQLAESYGATFFMIVGGGAVGALVNTRRRRKGS